MSGTNQKLQDNAVEENVSVATVIPSKTSRSDLSKILATYLHENFHAQVPLFRKLPLISDM